MQINNSRGGARRCAGVAIALVLIAFGGASVLKGIDGLSTVREALALEHVRGQAGFTPAAIAAKAKAAGLSGVKLPACSVAGQAIDNGTDARCFAQYMRIDALIATGGKTYAQMPRFASKDGKGTNVEAEALKLPNGLGMPNPARNVWITQTALSTALNTSYMAEQISLFGIAVGGAFLLVGLGFGAVALGGARLPRLSHAGAYRAPAEKVAQAA